MKAYLPLIYILSLFFAPLSVEAKDIGQVLPPFALEDQSGEEHRLGDNIKRIYANNSRAGDKLMEAAMQDLQQTQLDQQQALVVADISKAPGFVKRIIRSGLKDRGYTTLLDKRGSTRKFLRYAEDRVTVIELEQRKIVAIRSISDADTLRRELQQNTANSAAPQEQPDESITD